MVWSVSGGCKLDPKFEICGPIEHAPGSAGATLTISERARPSLLLHERALLTTYPFRLHLERKNT